MRADSHMHLFRQRADSPAGSDELALYETFRREYDISCALVVAAERPALGGTDNNAHVADLAQQHSWMAPVAYLHVDSLPGPADLDRFVADGFIGVTMFALSRDEARQLAGWPPEIIAGIGRRFTVVSLNLAAEVIDELGDLIAALDGCTVLISHLGLPGQFARAPTAEQAEDRLRSLVALSRLDHVGVKVSGYYAVSDPKHAFPHPAAMPFVELLMAHFGPGRLYWGSDFPGALRRVSFAQTVHVPLPAGLSDVESEAIAGGNLLRLLGREGALRGS